MKLGQLVDIIKENIFGNSLNDLVLLTNLLQPLNNHL